MFRIVQSVILPSVLRSLLLLLVMVYGNAAVAASKTHVISFGKWTTVQSSAVEWLADLDTGAAGDKTLSLKVRPLLVDARVKEFTFGAAHDVTDRLFVVRRAFRVNDSLPQEWSSPPHWQWQRGGWLLIDRVTGRISALNLPEFDASYSAVSWYRDYAAYCGVSDDGKKVYAVEAQISRRKPVLKKLLEGAIVGKNAKDEATQDLACPVPDWQRAPARVTFEPVGASKQMFAIRGHTVDLINDEEDEEEAAK
jgi:hypothetical protein